MTTATTRLTHAVMIVAALAAIVIVAPLQAAPAKAPAEAAVVSLPRVTVTGKRANFAPPQVVQMPKVTITGHRLDRHDTLQARRAEQRPAQVVACAEPATVSC